MSGNTKSMAARFTPKEIKVLTAEHFGGRQWHNGRATS